MTESPPERMAGAHRGFEARKLAPHPAWDATRPAHREPQGPQAPQKGIARMARLVGVDLPRDKRIEVALTYIYGIGRTRAQQLLATTGVDPNARVHTLGDDELVKLRDEIEANFKIEGDLRREVQADIRRKIEIGSYQGRRHRQGLPVRGQRTKTNARTRKGPKRTVAGKKKAK